MFNIHKHMTRETKNRAKTRIKCECNKFYGNAKHKAQCFPWCFICVMDFFPIRFVGCCLFVTIRIRVIRFIPPHQLFCLFNGHKLHQQNQNKPYSISFYSSFISSVCTSDVCLYVTRFPLANLRND